MALDPAILKAEILKVIDPNDLNFVGWPANSRETATNWANAVGTYFDAAGVPPDPLSGPYAVGTSAPALVKLIMLPTELVAAKTAFQDAMKTSLDTAAAAPAPLCLDLGLAAFAASLLLVPPKGKTIASVVTLTPPVPPTGPPTAIPLAPLILRLVPPGVPPTADETAGVLSSAIHTWFSTGKITVVISTVPFVSNWA